VDIEVVFVLDIVGTELAEAVGALEKVRGTVKVNSTY
jgi:hypothetical protein